MNLHNSVSWLCGKFDLSEAVLLLRNREGELEVAVRLGLREPAREGELLAWANQLFAENPGIASSTGWEAVRPDRGIFRQLDPQQVPPACWHSPVLAAAPLVAEGQVTGLLMLGGKPDQLDRAARVIARALSLEMELQQMKERLGRLERMAGLGELVYHVAHDINNPLTTVVGYAQLLEDRVRDSLREQVGWLRAEAERALGISRSVLSLARDEEQPRAADLNLILERVLALREGPLRLADVHVQKELEPDLPLVRVNSARIQQGLLNIVINAEHALEEVSGPRILELRTRKAVENGQGAWVHAEIFNNGPAIPPGWLGRIFEPFFTSKPKDVGTGLGLAIARSAVEVAGGEISAANEQGGVLFRVRLPAAGGNGEPLPGDELFLARGSLRGKHVLVLEDEQRIAKLIEDVLRAEGCRVTSCGTAEEVLATLERDRFDALVCDLKMPGKGGRWLFEHISQTDHRLARHTLFLTGDTVSKSTVAFLRSSRQPALGKPFHVRELQTAVANLFVELLP